MREHRALAFALAALGLGVATCAVDACDEQPPASSRPRRRARARRAPRSARWSGVTWGIAPADAGSTALASWVDGFDAGAPDAARAELAGALCAPLARSLCAARARCGCETAEGCVGSELARCEDWLECAYPRVDPALVIDPQRVRSCVARVGSEHDACVAPPMAEDCYSVLVDPAVPGEACRDDVWTYCVGGACIDGRCEREPSVGAPCDGPCAESYVDAEGECRCASELSCEAAEDCGPGHACADGRCRRLRRAFEACGDDGECAARLACVDGRCAHVERCARHDDCLAGDVCEGASQLRCTTDGTPLGGRGDACIWTTCEDGLACHAGRCVDAPCEGEPCPDAACARGLACIEGRCATRDLPLGSPCEGYADRCAVGLRCHGDEDARCKRMRGEGELCDYWPCARGLWCRDVFEAGRCAPELCDDDRADTWSCDLD